MDSYDNDMMLLLLDDDLFWKEEDNVQPVLHAEYVAASASNPG